MSFLSTLASTLLDTYGNDLSHVAVVFPNKRASLFLDEELAHLSDRPLWSPAYITISDLFRSQSDLEVADPIKLICDLHKSFVKCTGIDEKLDHFYGWGQVLLSDFDDVDKHLAPVDKVFANLRNIHEFDDDTYLTQQQRDIIRKFFSNFNEDHNTELKQRFLSLWSHIYDIYVDFNARLKSQGLAYEGALYRKVIESFSAKNVNASLDRTEEHALSLRKHSARGGTTSQDVFERKGCSGCPSQYVFAGFNLLLPVEQALIDRLKSEGKACLIQDTDEETPKHITFISAPTENIQARYVSTWLKDNNRIQAGRKTAIVLADERLLQTVTHCLPDEVTKVNITTGYPLSQTAAAREISQGGVVPEGQVLSSQNIPHEEERRARTFWEERNLTQQRPLELEALYRLQLIRNRLQELIDSGDLQVTPATYQRLLTQLINSTTIPFHGEPIEGIQIMGVLETRNIDFDHVLLLSCNEGNIPKGINDTSFIPYSIRKAYGLTTIDNKVAIYAHYFRRLLQRAKDVTLVYNNSTNDGKTGEMSRFMLQLMVESPHPITYQTLQAGQTPIHHHPTPIQKTPKVMDILHNIELLSPSALARYLRCPLQFFYHDICNLSESNDPDDDLIDNRLFGNIFHKAAQIIYSSLISSHSRVITSSILQSLLEDEVTIQRAVDQAIKLELFHLEDPLAPMPKLNGLHLINREVIIKYLHQLLEVDLRLTPFTILALETPLNAESSQISTLRKHSARGGTTSQDVFESKDLTTTNIGGIVDRIDKITLPDGTDRIRIIDYKTGSSRLRSLPDIASIFDPANIRYHSDYYLQAILYALIYESSESHEGPISPCLLFIQHASTDSYDPTLLLGNTPITDISLIKDAFLRHLGILLSNIYDESRPFTPTDDRIRCKTCPFFHLCG